jgi:ferredoxin-NADP reductase
MALQRRIGTHWYGTNVKPGDKLPFSAVFGDTVLGTSALGTHWVLASHHFTGFANQE